MLQEKESAPAVLGYVPYMYQDRDDQRVSACSSMKDQDKRLTICGRFDSSMMNGLQAVPTWDACMCRFLSLERIHSYVV